MSAIPFKELNWRHLLYFALACLLLRETGIALHRAGQGPAAVVSGAPPAPLPSGTKALTLIILFNHPPWPGVADFLASLYGPHFRQVVFTGPEPYEGGLGAETPAAAAVVDAVPVSELRWEGQRYIPCTGDHAGFFGYWCVAQAVAAVGDLGAGALYAGDDAPLNVTAMQGYPRDQLWATFEFSFIEWTEETRGEWFWWGSTIPVRRGGKTYTVPMGYEALRSALGSLSPELLARLFAERPDLGGTPVGAHVLDFGLSDVYYVPAQHAELFVALATHFRHSHVFLELAVPHIFQALRAAADHVTLRSSYLWDRERSHDNVARLIEEGGLDMLHPIKPSSPEGRALMAQFVNRTRGQGT